MFLLLNHFPCSIFTGESSTSGGSSETGSFDKTRMAERKRMALEPDSFEEQEFRRSFDIEYNRSFESHESVGDSEQQTLKMQPGKQRGPLSSDVESQSSFDMELPTLREQDRPSFDLPEEDAFLIERQKFFENQAGSFASSTESEVPPPPKRAPRRGGKSPALPPSGKLNIVD